MQYQNTTIYSRSLELITLTKTILESMPPGFGFLADQLRRASSSVLLNFAEGYGKSTKRDARRYFTLLNFAEGYGKSTKRDARRYFTTARGSANEVAAILDIAREFELIDNTQHTRGLELCDHLARMLTRFRH
jgi:hypothetical protein